MFEDDHLRQKVIVERKGQEVQLLVFGPQDPIKGKVLLEMSNLRKGLQHNGIKLVLSGVFECQSGLRPQNVVEMSVDLCGPGVLTSQKVMYPFEFAPLKQYESFSGAFMRLKYVLRVNILSKSPSSPVETEIAFVVPNTPPMTQSLDQTIKVSTSNFQLKLTKNVYAIDDVLMGSLAVTNIDFALSKIDLTLVRKEFVQIPGKPMTEKIAKPLKTMQLVDGALAGHDIVPIRIFLKKLPLSPSMKNVGNIFTVSYFLSFDFFNIQGDKKNYMFEIELFRSNQPPVNCIITPPVNVVNLDFLTPAPNGFKKDLILEQNIIKPEASQETIQQPSEQQKDEMKHVVVQQEVVEEKNEEINEEVKEEVKEVVKEEKKEDKDLTFGDFIQNGEEAQPQETEAQK
ncbi:vacuolar protein sorting-associated protein, putative [Entamoeba invadens IP1]|uniref:Vacuolar protein sorting-associated protein, putative n=1 Tax=Entamoeba invadens IP1 TaxID=370355 RepID=A0A0A1U6Y6_ENTIV|nr:vacuolar protein sorting-associated protein, putative [Entamoeba invadens IP1]ELP90173.1 vacuolar protein sorting-associated protein, putative [Entamoeba invadens IP1]|eukprot:XP_004256944.1 vacuolar protein sorting-associated protein, putative [Entamoeba invadens IP1]